ncbi:MAG: MAPEG family protein [Pseudomonadota bacterium]
MTGDLWALVAVLILAMVQVGIQSIATLRQAGAAWVAGPRDTPFHVTGLSGRLVRAHRNLLEILPQFTAALFIVHAAGVNGPLSVYGAWAFFLSRCLYVPAYAFGPPGLRSVFWQGGQIGILVILADIIR